MIEKVFDTDWGKFRLTIGKIEGNDRLTIAVIEPENLKVHNNVDKFSYRYIAELLENISTGVSMLHPNDDYDPMIGDKLALRYALNVLRNVYCYRAKNNKEVKTVYNQIRSACWKAWVMHYAEKLPEKVVKFNI